MSHIYYLTPKRQMRIRFPALSREFTLKKPSADHIWHGVTFFWQYVTQGTCGCFANMRCYFTKRSRNIDTVLSKLRLGIFKKLNPVINCSFLWLSVVNSKAKNGIPIAFRPPLAWLQPLESHVSSVLASDWFAMMSLTSTHNIPLEQGSLRNKSINPTFW